MVTRTKIKEVKNEKMAEELLKDATRAAEEAKQVMDTMLKATNQAVEESRPLVRTYKNLLETNLKFWQEYSHSTMDLVNRYTQQFCDEWFTLREEWDKITEDNLKKSQDLFVAEQTLAFEAAEAFQAQLQAASERTAKMFTPITIN